MEGHASSHESGSKSPLSARRLAIIVFIMVAVAAIAWLPTLFSRGPTYGGSLHTATDVTLIFIPAWLTLTIAVVVICFYFFKTLVTVEKNRDSEPVGSKAPAHH